MKKLRRILGIAIVGVLSTTTPVQACTPDFGNELANERAKYIMHIFDDILLEQLADYNKSGMLTSSEVTKDGIVYIFDYVEQPLCGDIVDEINTLELTGGISDVSAVINVGRVKSIIIKLVK